MAEKRPGFRFKAGLGAGAKRCVRGGEMSGAVHARRVAAKDLLGGCDAAENARLQARVGCCMQKPHRALEPPAHTRG